MNAILLAVVGLAAFAIGYGVYSRFVATTIYRLDPNFKTPSHELEDGVDYVPTNRFVLWGHHFTSVAGAAPIVGPAIAVIWGWLPAFLWVVLGTIFFAGVHDFGALWASVRNRARSVGALTEDIVGKRARSLFMIVIFLVLLMVNAVFAIVIANLFVDFPSSVAPTWIVIAVALVVGYLLYRRGVGLLWPSVGALVVLYLFLGVGQVLPISLPDGVFGLAPNGLWVIVLFTYAFIASLLPVWLLLQPRDYVNGLQLFIGLGILYLAILLANPTVVAPAINPNPPTDVPPLVPLLFVTIACGAISGFHGLVASGTTSKQLDKETDARFVGYLGSSGEGALALATVIACTAGFASLGDWEGVYSSFAAGGASTFVQGGAAIINQGLGIPTAFAATLLSVMVVLFAATTMDTGVRLQRYIIQEWGTIYNLPVLGKGWVATGLAVAACVALAFGAGEGGGTGGLVIWPLFGATNQLLAGLTLLVITVFLRKLGRPTIYTLLPMVFLVVMTVMALFIQLGTFWQQQNWLLVSMGTLILIAAIWVSLESFSAFYRARQGATQPGD
ncbi:carbon starvation CstA family protein [Truepera radiovictrix]|uniref:Carbon starvation protein CstA n=1 Tax=Truepera radiovictrix (strain DSM 17093 / CIP 108686 / LMG 22925 / RQ-24) TaxID=649638 RepID=D7CVB7_TRURR|nr:carbon starvation protein A [Truepera radiovictrix]ADI14145.1 carbon starvation protein CstA [Truepera radiovictrix DSM 17093]WMT57293.1 carbon starvation protein A [Truepera radiovictrix]